MIQKIRDQQKGEHSIDTLQIIAERIGAMAMGGLMMRKIDIGVFKKNTQKINSLEDFEEALKDVQKFGMMNSLQLEENMKNEVMNSELKDIDPAMKERMMTMVLLFSNPCHWNVIVGPEDFEKIIYYQTV